MDFLFEATREYVKKVVDPALMTFDEYRDLVDKEHKGHPSTAYQSNVEDLNRYNSVNDFETLLNTITRKGLDFEIREHEHDRWQGKYVKTDEDGKIVRGPDGLALYMSPEEISQRIPEDMRFSYEYAVVDKESGDIVAVTQDEWGTVLVMTAEEYRGFGFASIITRLKYSKHPDKPSGGFTSAGFATFKRMHSEMVRDYVSSGMYSYLVNNGVITVERAKEIIDSVSLKRPHKKDTLNLNTSNPNDWLVMINDSVSYAIIYDKKIYDLPEEMLDGSHWEDRFIKGSIAIGGREPYHLTGTAGDPKIKAYLIEIMLNGEIGSPLVLDPDEYNLVKDLTGLDVSDAGQGKYLCTLPQPTLNLRKISNTETRYRKRFDKYDEMYHRITELADSMRVE